MENRGDERAPDGEPLTFVVRAFDGRVLDMFREDEFLTWEWGHPEKTWHEAACWAVVAFEQDRQS